MDTQLEGLLCDYVMWSQQLVMVVHFFLCVLHILNIKIKSIKLLVGESTPIKCLCFHRWTVLSTTLEMHYGGEGCVTDAKVMESQKQTVFGAQYIISEVLVV